MWGKDERIAGEQRCNALPANFGPYKDRLMPSTDHISKERIKKNSIKIMERKAPNIREMSLARLNQPPGTVGDDRFVPSSVQFCRQYLSS